MLGMLDTRSRLALDHKEAADKVFVRTSKQDQIIMSSKKRRLVSLVDDSTADSHNGRPFSSSVLRMR